MVGKHNQRINEHPLEEWRRVAINLAKANRWQEALALNKRIISQRIVRVEDYNRLAKAYKELNQLDEAIYSYKKALELDPTNHIAQRNIRQIKSNIKQSAPPISDPSSNESNDEVANMRSEEHQQDSSFSKNSRVRLKNSGSTGIITDILPNNQYRVFISSGEEPIVPGADLVLLSTTLNFIGPQQFLRDLLLFKLKRPLSDTLYSYSMSRTNFEPYQFKPAIKFLRNPNSRILLADEVGLGKTIEACLIYLELKARMRGDLPRVLIVCPAGLRAKWQSELSARFNEEFEIMDNPRMRDFLSRYESGGPTTRLRGICSIEGLRHEQIVSRIVETQVQFDFVIIDEAHHMRNPDTANFDLGEILSDHADALALLTATPVQLHSDDLFYLLRIMDSGQFESRELFDYQLELNKLLNKTILDLSKRPPDLDSAQRRMAASESYFKANPYYDEALELIDQCTRNENSQDNHKMIVRTIRNLHQLNPFSLIFNRTRRKDVTGGAIRQAIVVNVDLTSIEREIYTESLNFARARTKHEKGISSVSVLGLIQIERQIASSISAFGDIIKDFDTKKPYDATIEEGSTELDRSDSLPKAEVFELSQKLRSLYTQLGETDSKFDRFLIELDKILNSDPLKKVIVFAFFKKTLNFLHRQLLKSRYKVELIHGDVKVSARQAIIDRFRNEDECRILLSSEVGAEGLDMQFCDTVINYDLPWNPMRVEQRIGRIDRYGQTSEKITVVSFFLNGTIEERILQRLYDRIGIFEESIGGLEPILGNIERELPYEIYSKELTEEQEESKTEEFLNTLENRRLEAEEFEANRYELIGSDEIYSDDVTGNINGGRFVSAHEIRALVSSYFIQECGGDCLEEVDRVSDNWLVVLNPKIVENLRAFLFRKGARIGKEDSQFLGKIQKILSPGSHYITQRSCEIPVTFNSDLALKRPILEFINVWHPLVRLAYYTFNQQPQLDPEARMVRFKMGVDQNQMKGVNTFFLFCISTRSILTEDELVTVVIDKAGNINYKLSEDFLNILQNNLTEESEHSDISIDHESLTGFRDIAVQYMANLRQQREDATVKRNDALISTRRGALEKTFEAKKNRALLRLNRATDDRIIRMHEGEIRNLQSKLEAAIEDIESKKHVSVTYEPVAIGIVEFTG